MRPVDQHVHSRHSFDCETEPADNIRQAIAADLAGVSFTEHFDTHPQEWPDCRYDDEAYSQTISDLRRQFSNDLFIGKGIEVCYQPDRAGFITDFLERHEFDVVMLSVHWAGSRAFHRREHWTKLSVSEAAGSYFNAVLEAVRWALELRARSGTRVFDVLGHLDLIKRYSHRFREVEVVAVGHEGLIDRILTTCLEAELIPEINTSTLRSGLDDPMPGPAITRRYAQLGGTSVSLGSDAHTASAVGAAFGPICAMLPQWGIESLAHFRSRHLTLIPLTTSSPD